jgi:DNA mismatch repair ATPase MutS
VITGLTALVAWPTLFPFIATVLGLHAVIGLALHEKVRPILHSGRDLSPEISILGQGLSLLASQKFTSPKLAELVARAAAAPQPLRHLERITFWMREREKDVIYGASLYLMLGTHLAVRMEQWRSQHAADLPGWIDAWAEFEALHSVATYAHEHPTDIFPDFIATISFDAENLGHPLLSTETCVPNSIRFDTATRFWIISGSNMAGKSTLLRSIGTNVVLALAGAPVRAAKLTLAPFHICASISTADSLLEGKSRFMAEVERIRDTLTAASANPVLFLNDEVFSGTNSHDRRIAAESVIRALINSGAVGAISTHDLALTEIAPLSGLLGENVHMCSRSDEDALDFDYRVKPGVNRQSNALAIVRLAGVPL